jgi:hypothetical protein
VLAPEKEKTRVAGCWGVKSSLPAVEGARAKPGGKDIRKNQPASQGKHGQAPPSTANGIHQARLIGF